MSGVLIISPTIARVLGVVAMAYQRHVRNCGVQFLLLCPNHQFMEPFSKKTDTCFSQRKAIVFKVFFHFQPSTILVSAKVSAKAFIFGMKPTTPVVSRWTSCGKAGRYFLTLDLQGGDGIVLFSFDSSRVPAALCSDSSVCCFPVCCCVIEK